MNLKEYLQQIDESGELRIVKAGVDPRLELAALCRREFSKHYGGNALLFEQVIDSPFPVVANLFGSEQRASLLLHSENYLQFTEKIKNYLQQKTGTVAER
ncbi:MAG: UbiD family decarboxylase, partial [Desulfuromusa sp.]|nr:UbiD family decarboxylase [Desulfuromusa sp.]